MNSYIKIYNSLPVELKELCDTYYNPYTSLYNNVLNYIKDPLLQIRDNNFKDFYYRYNYNTFINDDNDNLTIIKYGDFNSIDILFKKMIRDLQYCDYNALYEMRSNRALDIDEFITLCNIISSDDELLTLEDIDKEYNKIFNILLDKKFMLEFWMNKNNDNIDDVITDVLGSVVYEDADFRVFDDSI